MTSRFSDLPVAVQLFFGAHEKDAMLLAHVFDPDAVVTERGRLFKGIASIVAWHLDFEARHPAHWFEPLLLKRDSWRVRARMRVRGAFPGSPVDLSYRIEMQDHRIVAIHVAPVPEKRPKPSGTCLPVW